MGKVWEGIKEGIELAAKVTVAVSVGLIARTMLKGKPF